MADHQAGAQFWQCSQRVTGKNPNIVGCKKSLLSTTCQKHIKLPCSCILRYNTLAIIMLIAISLRQARTASLSMPLEPGEDSAQSDHRIQIHKSRQIGMYFASLTPILHTLCQSPRWSLEPTETITQIVKIWSLFFSRRLFDVSIGLSKAAFQDVKDKAQIEKGGCPMRCM